MPGARPALALLLALAAMQTPARAQLRFDAPVAAALVAERDGIAPGHALTVAVQLVHDPQWHTYWRMPGDAGLPTRIRWRLPAGFEASAVGWPVPKKLVVGSTIDYGYEGEVMLLVDLSAPAAQVPAGQVVVGAGVDWLMCRDVCIPGHADLQITLALREPQSTRPTRWAAPIARARAQIPQPLRLEHANASIDAGRIRLHFTKAEPPRTLEFFPLERGAVDTALPQKLTVAASAVTLEMGAAAVGVKSLHGVLVGDGGPESPAGWAGEIEVPVERGR